MGKVCIVQEERAVSDRASEASVCTELGLSLEVPTETEYRGVQCGAKMTLIDAFWAGPCTTVNANIRCFIKASPPEVTGGSSAIY